VTDDELLLPAEDRCVHAMCGRPEAEHGDWRQGGIFHPFAVPDRLPRPEFCAAADITTQWECAHCGAAQEVGGVCDRTWMDCDECKKETYVQA
jgi:hypothetical protein